MKSDFLTFIFFLYFFINIPKINSNSFKKKKNLNKSTLLLDEEEKNNSFSKFITKIENTFYDFDAFDINNIEDTTESNVNSTIDTEVQKSSRGFSAGLILAIIIPCVVVIVGLGFLAYVCSRENNPSTNTNLPNKNNNISSSDLNKDENTGEINPRIKGNDSTVKI